MSATLKMEVHDDAKVLSATGQDAPRAIADVDVTVRNQGPGQIDLRDEAFEFELYDRGNRKVDGVKIHGEGKGVESHALRQGEEGTMHAHIEVSGEPVQPDSTYVLLCHAYDDRAKVEFQFL